MSSSPAKRCASASGRATRSLLRAGGERGRQEAPRNAGRLRGVTAIRRDTPRGGIDSSLPLSARAIALDSPRRHRIKRTSMAGEQAHLPTSRRSLTLLDEGLRSIAAGAIALGLIAIAAWLRRAPPEIPGAPLRLVALTTLAGSE